MSDDLLQLDGCKGRLTIEQTVLDAEFSCRCDEHGHVAIDVAPLPIDAHSIRLLELHHSPGRHVPFIAVTGVAPNGWMVNSNTAYIVSTATSTVGATEMLSARVSAARIDVTAGGEDMHPDRLCKVFYRTVGQMGFGSVVAECPAGRIGISGATSLQSFDTISGQVALESATVTSIDAWLNQCDRIVEGVLDVLSLAQGRLIRWSIREAYADEVFQAGCCRGRKESTPPLEPLWSYLHLQPALDLALAKYTAELRQRTGLDVAIEWFLMNPSYNEAKYLTAMTAIEHLVSVYVLQTGRANVTPQYFSTAVKPALRQALDVLIAAQPDANDSPNELIVGLRRIQALLGNLNRRSFKDDLNKMIDDYGVPLIGIRESIPKLVNIRNDIVHRGRFIAEDEIRLGDHLAVLREVVKRVFLTLLQYKGNYESYLEGPQTRAFPPAG